MQTQSVLNVKNLNIETTIITNPKLNKNKQLSAGIINEATKSAIYIETPYLINPFSISAYDGGKIIPEEQKSYSLVLKAHGGPSENADDIQAFFNYLKQLDDKAIDYGILHSQTFFKKKYTLEQKDIVVDLLYNKCVRPSIGPDGKVYPEKITLKVSKTVDLLPDILIFKDSIEPLEIKSWEQLQNIIPKGLAVKAIIQPRLYFVNSKFGINFRVLQVKLPNYEKISKPIAYAFSDIPVQKEEATLEVQKNEKISSLNEDYQEDSEVEVEEDD